MAVPFPDPGKWRLLDTADVSYNGDPQEVAARFAGKLASGSGHRATVHTPSWVSVFTIQQRLIPQMRAGRCFVAGDAAHVHSPASGQGMNTGIQDAFNLAWKLAMVVNGQASEDLLDSYGVERVPVGEVLLGATKKATALVALKSSLTAAALPAVFTVVRNVPAIRGKIERKIMASMSALGLTYAASPLTVSADDQAWPRPRPGERVIQVAEPDASRPGWVALVRELADPRWTLLVRVDEADAADAADQARALHQQWLSVRTVAAVTAADAEPAGLADPDGCLRRGLGLTKGGSWLLVRPDGYLAARGEGLTRSSLATVMAALPLAEPAPVGQ